VTVLAGERPGDDPNVETCGESRHYTDDDPPLDSCVNEEPAVGVIPPLDGGGSDDAPIPIDIVENYKNAVGQPYNQAMEKSAGSAQPVPMQTVLGSSNYEFVAPLISGDGREIGVNLSMVYNSQLWTLNSGVGSVTFNYDKGWPAAGWRLGYGRIVENFDRTTQNPNTNNNLLITPQGTRVPMAFDSSGGSRWTHTASDGSNIRLKENNPYPNTSRMTVFYPDGTQMRFEKKFETNDRWLPTRVTTPNGNYIEITYVQYHNTNFPIRWAIHSIKDTLGRLYEFKYAKGNIGPTGNQVCVYGQLRSIEGPVPGGLRKTLVRIDYDVITLDGPFGFPITSVVGRPANNKLVVVRRICYPTTGRGYVFSDFSRYGMPKKISVQKDMVTGSYTRPYDDIIRPTVSDGTEYASTQYYYNDLVPQTDVPRFTNRKETIYNDSRSAYQESIYYYANEDQSGITKSTVTPGPGLNVATVETIIDGSTGKPSSVVYRDGTGGTVLRQLDYTYDPNSPDQVKSVTDSVQGLATTTEYVYGTYDRLVNIIEKGFSVSPIRTTVYSYKDNRTGTTDGAYLNKNLLYLVDKVTIRNGGATGALIAQTDFGYDEYTGTNALLTYSLTGLDGYDTTYNGSYDIRGNVTSVKYYTVPGSTFFTRMRRYDVLGNVVSAEVSCCQKQLFNFDSSAQLPPHNYKFAYPISVTKGEAAPQLTTHLAYDFYTGLVTSVTSPGGQQSSLSYDTARRVRTESLRRRGVSQDDVQTEVTYASGVLTSTGLPSGYQNDYQYVTSLLKYKESYTDSSFSRTITTKAYFDGAGRTLRSGTLRADVTCPRSSDHSK
jgi:YD repeat-containing protein